MSLGRWLLPRREGRTDETDYMRLGPLLHRAGSIEAESVWSGKPITEFQIGVRAPLQHRRMAARRAASSRRRRGRNSGGRAMCSSCAPPPEELASIDKEPGLALHALKKYGDSNHARKRARPPTRMSISWCRWSSPRIRPFAGRTIGHIDFLRTLGVVVVGLWRRDGWMREEISQLRLREGDLLVLWGSPHTFAEITDHPGFLMMVPFAPKEHRRHRALVAVGIGAAVVVAAALRHRADSARIPRRRRCDGAHRVASR